MWAAYSLECCSLRGRKKGKNNKGPLFMTYPILFLLFSCLLALADACAAAQPLSTSPHDRSLLRTDDPFAHVILLFAHISFRSSLLKTNDSTFWRYTCPHLALISLTQEGSVHPCLNWIFRYPRKTPSLASSGNTGAAKSLG
ncbi:hypothetical protein B0J12DRAFT_5203 [Macrophomina phaseolina]|uniref:Secreted protein n=1 Tax=Macrophomina phaseolina TaxID=35725 RepID=A0ABQ8GTN9_9PEZI|nr:hypothetical protein B0J12DRAFT_5203 [Macrophomina phaseolina]